MVGERLIKSAIGPVIVGGVAAGTIGFWIGGLLEGREGSVYTVSSAKDYLEEAQIYATEAEQGFRDIQKYGEACLTLVKNFTTGGVLNGTEHDETDKIAEALLTDPQKSCGDNLIETTVAAEEITAKLDVYIEYDTNRRNEVNKWQNELQRALDFAEEDNKVNILKNASLAGLGLGSLIGFGIGLAKPLDSNGKKPLGGEEEVI